MVCGGVLHHLADKACPVGVVVFEPGPGRRGNHDLSGMVCVPRPGKAKQEYTTRLDVLLHKPLVDQMTAPRATGGIGRGTTALRFLGWDQGEWCNVGELSRDFDRVLYCVRDEGCLVVLWCWVRVGLLDFGDGGPQGKEEVVSGPRGMQVG